MKLLVILLCLLSERYLIHSVSYQRFFWFADYSQLLKKYLDKNSIFSNPWIHLAAIIAPIVVLVSMIYWVLQSILFGFLCLFFSMALFLYCLGPQNAFYPPAVTSQDEVDDTLIGKYFAQVNRQLFSVIFWYIIAGPIVVLTYRLITLCRDDRDMGKQAIQVTDIIEWIPARLSALLLLLVGNFQRGFKHFAQAFFSKPDLNDQLISTCGLQAVRVNDSDTIPLPAAESLVVHATIVFLVLIALCTLIA